MCIKSFWIKAQKRLALNLCTVPSTLTIVYLFLMLVGNGDQLNLHVATCIRGWNAAYCHNYPWRRHPEYFFGFGWGILHWSLSLLQGRYARFGNFFQSDRSCMRTKFGNELMQPSRPSSSWIVPKSSIVDCLPRIRLCLCYRLYLLKKISVQSIHESVFHCFPIWRHEIKVLPDQIYCDTSIAYLN